MSLKSKEPHLCFSLYPDCVPVQFHIAYTANEEEALKFFRKVCKEPELTLEPPTTPNWEAWCTSWKEHVLIGIQPNYERRGDVLAGLVAHEALHATYRMQRILGDCFNYEAQEFQAYVLQWLVTRVCDTIWAYQSKRQKRRNKKK